MKYFILSLVCLLTSYISRGQGLEDIIVETYYITDANDTLKWGADAIGINNVTYRVYVKMKPGYSLHSVYGAPGHPMKLSTTTSFYNHGVHGKYIANMIWEQLINNGMLMIDSWLSMGAGSQARFAVLKADDDTVRTINNASRPIVLQSTNALAGIPMKLHDGLMIGDSLPPRVTQVGLDSLLFSLDKLTTAEDGFEFETTNGGWGCLGGAKGYFPENNYVCIGQFTTDGDFNFEFNIQIGSVDHGVEQYVAKDPTGNERIFPGLIISKKALPHTGN